MTGNLDAAPFAPDDALAVQNEGAAFDAAHLPAIHVFHLDDAELIAQFFLAVGKQVEGKAVFRLEVFMRFEAVARNTVDAATQLLVQPGVLSLG